MGYISLIYDDPARYGESLLNVHCYQKSLIRRGPAGAAEEQCLLSDLPRQSAYKCAPLELCTRVKLSACVHFAQGSVDNCRVGRAEAHVSWLGDELNVGGVWCGRY